LLVELVRRYSNRADLHERLAAAVRTVTRRANDDQEAHDGVDSGRAPRVWRVRDRLTDADIEQLIAEFLAGTPKRVLAERYVISIGTVKNILRKHGVRRPNLS
jgi:hypothetical protein